MRNLFIVAAITAAAIASAQQAPSIIVTPTIAPNAFGSPSWSAWVGNSYQAQYNGVSTFGTIGTPTYYEANSLVTDRANVIVTGYNSWMGNANPTGAFASELGNRMHFGLHIMGNGNKFAINDLKFDSSSIGDSNGLGFGFGFGSYNYSNDYVGIDYVDGIRGNGNDVLVTSGLNTQLVDELIGRGSGNSYDSYTTDPGATNQDKLFGVAYDPAKQWNSYTGIYTLRGFGNDITGSGTFNAVPEPASMAALGIGALALIRKRRKKN